MFIPWRRSTGEILDSRVDGEDKICAGETYVFMSMCSPGAEGVLLPACRAGRLSRLSISAGGLIVQYLVGIVFVLACFALAVVLARFVWRSGGVVLFNMSVDIYIYFSAGRSVLRSRLKFIACVPKNPFSQGKSALCVSTQRIVFVYRSVLRSRLKFIACVPKTPFSQGKSALCVST